MMIRRILPVLIGILMISFCPLPVFAAESVSDAMQNAEEDDVISDSSEADNSKGQIQVALPAEGKEMSVHYAKIAAWSDEKLLQNDSMMELLGQPITYDGSVEAEGSKVSLTGLEDGIYRLDIFGPKEYEFASALVSIPMWSEEEKTMLYEVEVIPKYVYHEPLPDEEEIPPDVSEPDPGKTETPPSPKTGDESKAVVYASFGLISLIIVVIMSCHNRFRCATMSVK